MRVVFGECLENNHVISEFTSKLKALLAEYGEGTELECKDYWEGYSECGEDVHMTLYIPGKWDDDGNPIQEYCEINLGAWITP